MYNRQRYDINNFLSCLLPFIAMMAVSHLIPLYEMYIYRQQQNDSLSNGTPNDELNLGLRQL